MKRIIPHLVSAINARALYPAKHPSVTAALAATVAALARDLSDWKSDSLTFLIVGDDLVVEQQVVRQITLPQHQFIQVLKRRGIERLTIAAGLDESECGAFVSSIASGETPDSSLHIVLGRVQVGSTDDELSEESQESPWAEQADSLRECFADFRTRRALPIATMEKFVWNLIDSLSRATREILPLAKLREHDEYTFVHSVNVSMLVLAQARSFGFQGNMLHAFGMAGLLHDVGKLMIPLDVLNAPGRLDGEQWAIMQSHPESGAWYLSEIDGTTPLSIVVAYEHHFRVDGKPNYPVVTRTRLPNLATRMTSIADAYDAMSTVRPYKQAMMRDAGLNLLRERAGTFYDPLLVANFAQIAGADAPGD